MVATTMTERVMPHEEPAAAIALLPVLLTLSKTVRQLVGIKLAEIGVAVGQDQFLLCFDGDEARSVIDIAARLSVRASTVSKMADILARKGWTARHQDAIDARRVLIDLTDDGKRARDRVRVVEAALEAELLTAVGVDDQMIPTLSRLDAVLSKRLARLR